MELKIIHFDRQNKGNLWLEIFFNPQLRGALVENPWRSRMWSGLKVFGGGKYA